MCSCNGCSVRVAKGLKPFCQMAAPVVVVDRMTLEQATTAAAAQGKRVVTQRGVYRTLYLVK